MPSPDIVCLLSINRLMCDADDGRVCGGGVDGADL